MAYGVEITARAERDLADIYRHIEAENSPLAAKWFNGMVRAMSSLDRYPKRAPITPENRALRHLLYGKKPYVYYTGSFSKSTKKTRRSTFYTSVRPDVKR
jgi:plasmid stabilization system protein ParE